MKIPSLKELFSARLLLPGLLFFTVNFSYSYMFYQINSFKVFLVAAGVSIIVIWHDFIFPQLTEKRIPWKQLLLVSFPLIATLPGYFWHQEFFNYNFRYELASNLILIIWIGYLIRITKEESDLVPFLFLIVVTIIYVCGSAVLEKIGYHPSNWAGLPAPRVKSSFGNANYFAGFLVVVIPLLLVFAVPQPNPDVAKKRLAGSFTSFNLLCCLGFVLACASLYFTKTRAAQVSIVISLFATVFIFALVFASPQWRRRILILVFCLATIGISTILLLYLKPELIKDMRYAELFTIRGWSTRYVSWQAAVNSILASPVIGFGLGSSYNLYFKFADPEARLIWPDHSYNHAHSEILEYTQEAGIVGLLVFLIFWVYLAYLLFQAVRSSTSSSWLKKVSIAVIGGFIGYHLHGSFSVAPRMMVTKLPLFTLIGLTFVVQRLSSPPTLIGSAKSYPERIRTLHPWLLAVSFVWYIFVPWIIGQYHHVKTQQKKPSLVNVRKMEKIVETYPDIYALYDLVHQQIQYKRIREAQKTVYLIDRVLPRHRELGYTKAVLMIFQGRPEEAKRQALRFQNDQDRYYQPTIYLLIGLSIDTNDFKLFSDQLQLFTKKIIFEADLFYSFDTSHVSVSPDATLDETKTPFSVVANDTSFHFRWNAKYLKNVFDVARQIRKDKQLDRKNQNEITRTLAKIFFNNPYFKINTKKESRETETEGISKAMRNYFLVAEEADLKVRDLEYKHKIQLAKTPASERPALQKKLAGERSKVQQSYREQTSRHERYLLVHTDWETFLKKRNFVKIFSNRLTDIFFLRSGD